LLRFARHGLIRTAEDTSGDYGVTKKRRGRPPKVKPDGG
jgi:hypothetical protein